MTSKYTKRCLLSFIVRQGRAKQQQNDIKTAEGDAYVLNGDNFLLENKFVEAIEEYKKAQKHEPKDRVCLQKDPAVK